MQWLTKIASGLVVLILVRAILLWLHTFGIYPEEKVAEVLTLATTPQVVAAISWTIAGIGGVLGLIYGPKLIERRRSAAIETTSEQSTDSEEAAMERGFYRADFQRRPTRDKAIHRQALLRTDGIAIRNAAMRGLDETNLGEWRNQAEHWSREVIKILAFLSAADAELFRTLDAVPPARMQAPLPRAKKARVREFEKTYKEHDYRLVMLEELVARYRG
jgi:hypothetical protein